MNSSATFVSPSACSVDAWNHPARVCVLAFAFVAAGCSTVRPVDAPVVRSRVLPLRASPSAARHCGSSAVASSQQSAGPRYVLLDVLRSVQCDFGTTLTPRHLASRLGAIAHGTESLGGWVFELPDSPFDVEANAMSIDSPVDWLRVTIRAELGIQLADLTKLFSDDYSVLRGGAESIAVEFRSTRRMNVAAELRNDRPGSIGVAPVLSVQLRRPGYDPSVATLARQHR